MKKFLLILLLALKSILAYSQAWVTDEIAQEAAESDGLSLWDFFYGAIVVILIYVIYKIIQRFRLLSIKLYKKYRNRAFIGWLIITAIIPVIVLTYYDIKRDNLHNKAIATINEICKNADSYIDLDVNISPYTLTFSKILNKDKDVPTNLITRGVVYDTSLEIVNSPYEGVYSCFDTSGFGHQVVFAGKAKKMGFSSDENPVLYHFYIKPYRIRYYRDGHVNPWNDLKNVYGYYLQKFINNNGSHEGKDFIDNVFGMPLNEYYEINHVNNTGEPWEQMKQYYEADIVQERAYEYETEKYDMFDITWTISRPCTLGVCEKLVHGKVLWFDMFDEIHLVKRAKALERFGIISLIVLICMAAAFYFGKPKEPVSKNSKNS